MRFFLDANVLFSAAYSADGKCRALFTLAELSESRLISSAFAIEEAARNLRLKRPVAEPALATLISKLTLAPSSSRRAMETVSGHRLPPKDIPIFAAAAAAGASVLVTGDLKHFGQFFGSAASPLIVLTPAEAVALLLNRIERRK